MEYFFSVEKVIIVFLEISSIESLLNEFKRTLIFFSSNFETKQLLFDKVTFIFEIV